MSEDHLIASPTYMEHIRYFFTEIDKQCMGGWIDLSTYEGVRRAANKIYIATKNGSMPKGKPRWSEERVQTFENWIINDFPRGTINPVDDKTEIPPNVRVRKNIAQLDSEEIIKLKQAFDGLKNRDINNPTSYYQLAGIHWLPKPNTYCRHHEDGYNSWHRIYLLMFENALRTVEGCENVTLPYWDFQANDMPDILFEEPFDKFIYPENLTDFRNDLRAVKNNSTERYSKLVILQNMQQYGVNQDIVSALSTSWWEKFNGWDAINRRSSAIIRAHDSGHVACGLTLEDQNVAAFDPLFWFFHCNWDRLWWKWQQLYGATTVDTFKSHLPDTGQWMTNPISANLEPFHHEGTTDFWTINESIDSYALGVGYEHPEKLELFEDAVLAGHEFARHKLKINPAKFASVRLKNLDRLKIPGSFSVSLLVNGTVIRKHGFFQPTTPAECEACSKKGVVSFDFLVEQNELEGEIEIEVDLIRDGKKRKIPLSALGDPTVNIRLLLGKSEDMKSD